MCLHAASLNAVEGASAAATAAARATRAEAMEKESSSANEKAEAWSKAAVARAAAAAATAREETLQEEAPGEPLSAEELRRQAEELERTVREQNKHRALSLVRSSRSRLFRRNKREYP